MFTNKSRHKIRVIDVIRHQMYDRIQILNSRSNGLIDSHHHYVISIISGSVEFKDVGK